MASLPRILALVLLSTWALAVSAQAVPKSYKTGSLAEIREDYDGQAFILMFWSLDCASCMKELDALAESIKKHPDLKIVMISTDDETMSGQVGAMLHRHGLGAVESWVFTGSNSQQLRYEVDPSWFGELPRSYFYDASHRRIPHSGALTSEQLDAWTAVVGGK